MHDPALAGALTAAALLALGGIVVIPRAVICVGAGAVLGWSAVLPAMAGTAVGMSLGFVLARFVLQGAIQRFVAARPKARAVMRAIDAEGWRLVGLLRLASPVPGPLVNVACGVSRMGFVAYFLASMLGVLPQTLLFVFLGLAGSSALETRSFSSVHTLSAVVGVVLTAVALWRLKRAAKRHWGGAMAETDGTAA